MRKREAVYALYRGDEYLEMGTLEELAERHGISPNSIYFKSTPTYFKRASYEESIRAYKVLDDDIHQERL